MNNYRRKNVTENNKTADSPSLSNNLCALFCILLFHASQISSALCLGFIILGHRLAILIRSGGFQAVDGHLEP